MNSMKRASFNPAHTLSRPLLTVAEMYAADQLAAARGVATLALMEAAGAAVVREVQKRWPKQHVLILCGPGNNGGDGFVIARLLFNAGWPVYVALAGDLATLKGDAAINAQRWRAAGGTIQPWDVTRLEAELVKTPLVIDALFGAGLSRPLGGEVAAVATRIAGLGLRCVAVDVPSGVHGDSGTVLTDDPTRHGAAFQCALTVTFFQPKLAHVLYPGRALCGEIVVADIGIPAAVLDDIKPQTWINGPALWALPSPDWRSHKYTRGHALIFGGGDMTGAARLAGRAARRAGVGLLTYAVPPKAHAIYASEQPGAFVRALENAADIDDLLSDHRKNAILIGPGLGVGAGTSALVMRLLGTNRPLVLDADALTSFATDPQLLFEAIKARTAPTVLTPHEAEFRRLFQMKGSKPDRVRAAAAQSGAVVILKGPDSVVGAPDGRVVVNDIHAPWLATGGSGDVLAGVILSLLAQGMTPWHAACAAVWLHAQAGATAGPGLLAEDLPELIADHIKII
jgi:NAD(P)H-hydrate epimerase